MWGTQIQVLEPAVPNLGIKNLTQLNPKVNKSIVNYTWKLLCLSKAILSLYARSGIFKIFFLKISQIRLQLREEEEETPLYTDKLQAHLVYIWRLEPFFSSKCGEFEGLH